MVQKNSLNWNPRTGVSYLELPHITPANLKSLIDGCVVDRCTAPPDLLADLERLPHKHYDSLAVGGLKGIEARREGSEPVEFEGPRHNDVGRSGSGRADRYDRDGGRRREDYNRDRDDGRRERDSRDRQRDDGPRDEYRRRSPPRRSRSPLSQERRGSDYRESRGGQFNSAAHDTVANGTFEDLPRNLQVKPTFEPPQPSQAEQPVEKKRKSRWD